VCRVQGGAAGRVDGLTHRRGMVSTVFSLHHYKEFIQPFFSGLSVSDVERSGAGEALTYFEFGLDFS
jgi:hypothetical protein